MRTSCGLFSLIVLSALLVSGCSFTNKGLDPGPATATPLAMLDSKDSPTDYPIDLAQLIQNSAYALPLSSTGSKPAAGENVSAVSAPQPPDGGDIEKARKFFYESCRADQYCGELRNRVQDRLIWASENACADYLSSVRKSFTRTNLNLGGATTLFGALGSVVTALTRRESSLAPRR